MLVLTRDVPPPACCTRAAGAAAQPKPRKVRKTDVPYTVTGVAGMSPQALAEAFEAECKMQASDRLQEDTNEAKNALEG